MSNKTHETIVIPPEIIPNPSGILPPFGFAKSFPLKEVFIFGIHLNVHKNANVEITTAVHIVYDVTLFIVLFKKKTNQTLNHIPMKNHASDENRIVQFYLRLIRQKNWGKFKLGSLPEKLLSGAYEKFGDPYKD